MAIATAPTPIRRINVRSLRIPTEEPESDGTYRWDATTMILVEVEAGDCLGFGYTYASAAAGSLIDEKLRDAVEGCDAMNLPGVWRRMAGAIRNEGRPGVSSAAISAVDAALWDLKAKLLDVPLTLLLGQAREAIDVYGSGGFTSYSTERLCEQLQGWAGQGILRVKMKVGRQSDQDITRVQAARQAIGDDVELFVDANGAYGRKQALAFAMAFREAGVTWFEEPVSSDDLEGLQLLRDRAPAGMEITAGEYGYDLPYFRRMLQAGAVDVMQADATRCGGVTGFLQVAALCEAFQIPLSSHCAPHLHVALGCALNSMRHLEHFHDHARIERMLFDGSLTPREGKLRPDLSRPGLGLELKAADAEKFAI